MAKHSPTPLILLGVFFNLAISCLAENIPSVPNDNGATSPSALPVAVEPGDANVRYAGRFDMSAPGAARCSWSASSIAIRFHGTAINAELDLGENRFEVVVDGVPVKVLTADEKGRHLYSLASGLPDSDHTALLFRCTQAYSGPVSFYGFQLNPGATVLPPTPTERRIEVIGDSISTGVGNEAANEKEPYSPKTDNAYWAYGAVAARAFGAEYTCFALGGKCLWPDNTLPSVYDRVFPLDPKSPLWDFAGPKPEVVLINLHTNDFNKGVTDHEGWVKAYHDFVDHIRKNYPDATIYLAVGPMVSDFYPAGAQRLTTARNDIQRVVKECNDGGDAKVHLIEFATQDDSLGLGAGWHPSLKRHQAMAKQFVSAIQQDLGWTPAAPAPSPTP